VGFMGAGVVAPPPKWSRSSSRTGVGAGSWASPARPPRPLRFPAGPSRTPLPFRRSVGLTSRHVHPVLRLSFEDAFSSRAAPSNRSAFGSRRAERLRGLLSWGCPKIAPPPSHTRCPLQVPPKRGPRRSGCHATPLVPPLSFLTTSTACSTERPAGLLHPATGHGVRRVSVPCARRFSPTSPRPSPRRTHPSELSPRPEPSHRHRFCEPARRLASTFTGGSALPPFSSAFRCSGFPCRHAHPARLSRRCRPQGLAPWSKSLAPSPRCQDGEAGCSLGLL